MKSIKYFISFILIILYGHIVSGQQISIQPLSKLSSNLGGVELVAFSSEGEWMIGADKKGNIQLWDIDELKSIANTKSGAKVIMADFVGDEILIVEEDGSMVFYDKELKELRNTELKEKIQHATLDPEKAFLSYVNKDNRLKIYSLSANMQQSSFNISARMKNAEFVGYDRFGQQLAVLARDGTSIVCNPVSQQIIKEVKLRSDEFAGSASVIHSAASSKGSELFVTGVQEVFIPKGGLQNRQPERRNSIMTYDWETSQEMKRIRVNFAVDKLVLGPGPTHITYYSDNRLNVTIVDLEGGAEVSQVTLEEYPKTLEISPDDAYMAAGDKNGTIYLFELVRNAAPEIKITKPSINRGYGDVIIEKENLELEGILSNDAKIKNITINNVQAEILPNGKFSADLDLIPGKNKIRIVAEDYQSNTVFKDVYITRNPEIEQIKKEGGTRTSGEQKRVALVIGNAEYEGTARLFNTVNDARAMSKALTELGFEVETIIDGSYEDIKNAIFAYGSKIMDVDVSMFYYSGHGLEIEGVNYLVPVDAQLNSPLDVKQKTVPLTGVMNTINYANDDGLNLVILDACRNNPFPTGKRGGAGLAKSTPPSGAIIAYSTAPGSTASDGEGEYGLYTGELVKQLMIPQRIEDVFINTRNNVEDISDGAQQPWEEARLRGIFYLNY